jgi:hypothetical protein
MTTTIYLTFLVLTSHISAHLAVDAEGGNSRPGGGEGDVEASQTHFKPRMLGELKGAGCNGSEFGASKSQVFKLYPKICIISINDPL